jgi:hypothetical protein
LARQIICGGGGGGRGFLPCLQMNKLMCII